MIFGINNKIEMSDMKVRIGELEAENFRLKDQLQRAKEEIEKINGYTAMCTPCIDFDTMRVFSIERNSGNGQPRTILGYYMSEPTISSDGEMIVNRDVVKEWTLHCNTQHHEALVKKFIEWKAKNVK